MEAQESNQFKLITQQGFICQYQIHLKTCRTQTEAYEKTESEHFAVFGKTKYSGYESFRQVKNRKKVNK